MVGQLGFGDRWFEAGLWFCPPLSEPGWVPQKEKNVDRYIHRVRASIPGTVGVGPSSDVPDYSKSCPCEEIEAKEGKACQEDSTA